MDLKELHYIITIADEGSISGAAEKLYMAQSSLSQFLQQYEAEIGTPIFVRTSRGVRPTAAGSVFLSHIRQIHLHYRRAQSELWDIEEMPGGRIEFGISTFRGTYLLPRVLKRFYEIYPKVHVEITELDSVELEERIMEGALDMALIALPAVKLKNNVDFLMKDEIYIVASGNHPVMKYVRKAEDGTPFVSFRDAAPFEFILGPPQTILGMIARNEFKALGIPPYAPNQTATASFAAAMARAGIGLALTYRSCVVPEEGVEYLRIGKDGVYLDLGLVYPLGEYRSKAARKLGELMHGILGTPS